MNPLAMLLGAQHGPAGPVINVGQNQGQGGNPSDMLRKIIGDIQNYMGSADDEADKATAAKCLQAFQSILATEQKQQESAMGTTPAHKFLRRTSQAAPSY